MMHTFVGEDEALVKQKVRGPLSGYLKTFIAQDQVLSEDQTGVEAKQISERDREEMINFAFERYFNQAALFGSQEKCARMVEWMAAVDVDEIACLVDFGVDHESVRESFQHLSQLRDRFSPPPRRIKFWARLRFLRSSSNAGWPIFVRPRDQMSLRQSPAAIVWRLNGCTLK